MSVCFLRELIQCSSPNRSLFYVWSGIRYTTDNPGYRYGVNLLNLNPSLDSDDQSLTDPLFLGIWDKNEYLKT